MCTSKLICATPEKICAVEKIEFLCVCLQADNRLQSDTSRASRSSDPLDFRPFTIDPTFDIGQFSVTVSTYRHLLLEILILRCLPFIGPPSSVTIQHKKTKDTYSSFCGVLKSLQPSLQDVLAFGTDDENALERAFDESFERAIHLLCQIHMNPILIENSKILE